MACCRPLCMFALLLDAASALHGTTDLDQGSNQDAADDSADGLTQENELAFTTVSGQRPSYIPMGGEAREADHTVVAAAGGHNVKSMKPVRARSHAETAAHVGGEPLRVRKERPAREADHTVVAAAGGHNVKLMKPLGARSHAETAAHVGGAADQGSVHEVDRNEGRYNDQATGQEKAHAKFVKARVGAANWKSAVKGNSAAKVTVSKPKGERAWSNKKWLAWKKNLKSLGVAAMQKKLKDFVMKIGRAGLRSLVKGLRNPRKAASRKIAVANKLKKLQYAAGSGGKKSSQKKLEAKMVGKQALNMASASKKMNKANSATFVNLINTLNKGGPSGSSSAGTALTQGELGRLLNKKAGSSFAAEDSEDGRTNVDPGADGKGSIRKMIDAPVKLSKRRCKKGLDALGIDTEASSRSAASKVGKSKKTKKIAKGAPKVGAVQTGSFPFDSPPNGSVPTGSAKRGSSVKRDWREADFEPADMFVDTRKFALLQSDTLECVDEATCSVNGTKDFYYNGPRRFLHDDGMTHSYSHVSQLQVDGEESLDEDEAEGQEKTSSSVWPGGEIKYCFGPKVSPATKLAVKKGIKDIQAGNPGCTTWKEVPLAKGKFFKGRKRCAGPVPSTVIEGNMLGCTSYVGAQKFEESKNVSQIINLQPAGCDVVGIIQHELLHLLGMAHEQMRSDRDKYISVQWGNIKKKDQANFAMSKTAETATSYDYASIMHYGLHDFANDQSQFSMKPATKVQPSITVGQRVGPSDLDRVQIYRMYHPEAKKKGRTCQYAARKVVKCTHSPPNWKDPNGNDCKRYLQLDKAGHSCKLNQGKAHCCGCGGGVRELKYTVQKASLKGQVTINGKKRMATSALLDRRKHYDELKNKGQEQKTAHPRKRKCCTSLTAKCASCWKKISEADYCKQHPSYLGCPGDWLHRIEQIQGERRAAKSSNASNQSHWQSSVKDSVSGGKHQTALSQQHHVHTSENRQSQEHVQRSQHQPQQQRWQEQQQQPHHQQQPYHQQQPQQQLHRQPPQQLQPRHEMAEFERDEGNHQQGVSRTQQQRHYDSAKQQHQQQHHSHQRTHHQETRESQQRQRQENSNQQFREVHRSNDAGGEVLGDLPDLPELPELGELEPPVPRGA
eukprot:TRINITY_DN4478_c1_g1_i1.p1 TRINITY_DN4478_c1_g1~~TRINITY_DN4478_c1_g1_i1.p1  ORF type:complete len:1124 (-),score=211.51 TRINITY_DN4478_c1_g1_i1:162-3533(-)